MSPDVLVVGAGVIGSSIAFHLTRLGAGRVEIVDRGTVGAGMSSRSSALVRMHYTFGPEVDLAVRSDRMFDAWPELVGRPGCIRRTGFVRLVVPGDEDHLRANVAMQRSFGADVELVGPDALAELAPGLRVDEVGVAAWERHGGYGDGAVVAGDFLAAARESGAAYRPGTAVEALVSEGDRVVGVRTAEGVIHAGTVVVAANVWSPALLASIGVEVPMETELHQVAVLRHPPGCGASVACIDSGTQTYFRPDAGGAGTLVGSFSGPRGIDPDRMPASASPDDLAELVAAVAGRVPALADAGVAGGTTGVYDMTPDGRPLIGGVEGWSGLVLAVGLSGTGFKISPAVGEAVAGLVVHGSSATVDLGPFRPGRFADGEPICPPSSYVDD